MSRKTRGVLKLVLGLAIIVILGLAWYFINNSGGSQDREQTLTSNEEDDPSSAIERAKKYKEKRDHKSNEYKTLEKEAAEFGIVLPPGDVDEYKRFRNRLFENDTLAYAIRKADSEGIVVGLGRSFYVGDNSVILINVDATDEEIIEFLLGK